MAYSTDLLTTKKRLTQWGHWCHQIITMGLARIFHPTSNSGEIRRIQSGEIVGKLN